MLTDWRLRLRALFKRSVVDHELDDEIRFHLERHVEQLMTAGLDRREALRLAQLEFGGVAQVKEEHRDARGLGFLQSVDQDVRYAIRRLRRSPGFALLCTVILALGIGANTAVFSVVNAVVLKPLPYPDPDRIVTLSYTLKRPTPLSSLSKQISVPDFQDWHDQTTAFDAMAYYATRRTSVMAGPAADYARLTRATPDFFRVFSVQPVAGRPFSTDEEKPGGSGAALISSAYARLHFGEPSHAVGQQVRMSARSVTVVGVLPSWFAFPDGTEIWFPADATSDPSKTSRSAENYLAVGQ